MKKIVFEMNPFGSFKISCEAYMKYYEKKYNKKIYFYRRTKSNTYIRVDNEDEICSLKNRVMTLMDLGKEVKEISYSSDIRVAPIDESYEDDDCLKEVVEELGERASWKNSNLKVISVD